MDIPYRMTNTSSLPVFLVIAGQFPPPVNGFAYITQQMTNRLNNKCHVAVVDTAAHTQPTGLRYHLRRLALTLKGLYALYSAHRQGSKTLYLACEGGLGLAYTFLFTLTARCLGFQTYLHHHSFQYIDRGSVLMAAILLISGDHLTHVFLCPHMAERFAGRYGQRIKTRILSNSAFVEERPLASKSSDDAPLTLGLLSNLSEDKGLGLFVQTMREALEKGLNVRGILAGPPASEKERALIEQALSEFSDKLAYWGPLYGTEKDRFFSAIDVFVFPTRYINEAQPTVIFEAMAYGVPVLSYDRGCIKGQVRSCGCVFAQEDHFADAAVSWLAEKATNKPAFERLRLDTRSAFLEDRRQALDVVDNLFSKDPAWISPR